MKKRSLFRRITAFTLAMGMTAALSQTALAADSDDSVFPLAETVTLTGTTTYPANTESDPNNRTIFQRLQEATNVEIEWTAISSDQWGDKVTLLMSNVNTLTDFIFNAGFSDSDLLRYADQGIIIALEDYIDEYMPNLSAVFEAYPDYRSMCEDEDGHIWGLPWIEQLGAGKTAIQTVGNNMTYINKSWLDFLGLEIPETVDEFEEVLLAFRDNAEALQAEFDIEGSIIPLSFIMNDQDPMLLINGFGEGYGDADTGRHIAVTDDLEVICSATQDGFYEGLKWMHQLYEEDLIDPEAFTQDWSTYVSKGKSGRYGVCMTWDIANVASLNDFVVLPALTADTTNVTPANGSFMSGFDRGRCVVTAVAENPELVCQWLDQMYAPLQSPQNNWGTYGEDDDFDIFSLVENEDGTVMLQHNELGDASPVEVREEESVNGPLAILNDYYGVYVTLPDDAAYRLVWIEEYYTPDMNTEYVYPNVLMNTEDTERLAELQENITQTIDTAKSDWVINGVDDATWESFKDQLEGYGLSEALAIYQKYLDIYYAD